MLPTFKIHHGHVLDVLRGMEGESVHCVVTSPPYWNLRDYGMEGQIGTEAMPEAYVGAMVDVFREVRRVLRKDGTAWLNIGPTYAGSGCGWGGGSLSENSGHHSKVHGNGNAKQSKDQTPPAGYKAKDMIGIPWLVAFALQRDGWYLRSEIIWAKPAPMPESVTDRPTRAHEQIFLLSKSEHYFYDQNAVRTPLKQASIERLLQEIDGQEGSDRANGGAKANGKLKASVFGGRLKSEINDQTRLASGNEWHQDIEQGANLRDVWTINTEGFKDAHFAVFPTEIPRRAILAGTSEKGVCGQCGAPWERVVERGEGMDRDRDADEGLPETMRSHGIRKLSGKTHAKHKNNAPDLFKGWQPTCKHEGDPVPATVLDPFAGSGTTGMVALRLGRNFVGAELNPEYVTMARNRIMDDAPLLNREAEALNAEMISE